MVMWTSLASSSMALVAPIFSVLSAGLGVGLLVVAGAGCVTVTRAGSGSSLLLHAGAGAGRSRAVQAALRTCMVPPRTSVAEGASSVAWGPVGAGVAVL